MNISTQNISNEVNNQIKNQECCPRFDPAPWDGKIFEWIDKKFIKNKVFTLFYMPINFSSIMKKCYEAVEKSGAQILDALWLSDHTSKWNMNLYVAVDKEVSGVKNITLSGKFLSRVYEGNFKDTNVWMKDFKNYAQNKGIAIKKIYMWYTTCPKCAKKYGKNYVAILAQIN